MQVAEITPIAFNNLGYHYFIVYAVLNAAWVPLLYFFFPESKFSPKTHSTNLAKVSTAGGRSLEEIDTIFTESNSVFDPPKIARRPSLAIRPGIGHEDEIAEGKESALHVEEVGWNIDEKV